MIATKTFDTLVVGGGISGLQSALDLGDQGYRVAVLEKDPSVGGKMIRLSKVFPTLDCASCITTPRMSAAAHHENISLFTHCSLRGLDRDGRGVRARVVQNPRYVDPEKCIGCRKCEYACPVYVPDKEQGGFSGKKAISIPFSNAIPQLPVLDTAHCMLCGRCEKACPTDAIDYLQEPEPFEIRAKTAIVTTGFELLPKERNQPFGEGRIPNVIDALQMERLLAPHGPYNRVLRPSDGMEPDAVAYVQCAGSRDRQMGVPYCSRVCCMYAIKQAMLLSGALPLADITIYYMDIRAFGKGYEQFYQNAKAMGIEFVKAKVGRIDPGENGQVQVRVERQDGSGVDTRGHDLVVLSMGMVPAWDPAGICPVSKDTDHFITSVKPKISPVLTDMAGVFTAGAAAGPKDIVDTITESGSAAVEAAKFMSGFFEEGL